MTDNTPGADDIEMSDGLNRTELRRAIYEMRKDGLTFREIAEYLPYGVSWVSREYREHAANAGGSDNE